MNDSGCRYAEVIDSAVLRLGSLAAQNLVRQRVCDSKAFPRELGLARRSRFAVWDGPTTLC